MRQLRKPMGSWALPIAAAAALLVASGGAASAASLSFDALSAAEVTAGDLHTNLANQGNDQVIDGTRMSAQASAHTEVGALDATAAAAAGGQVRFGRIAGTASTQSALGVNGNTANASANFAGSFSDVLTIESAVLTAGTPVVVRLGALGHFLAQGADSPGSSATFDLNYATDQGALDFQHALPPLAPEYRDLGFMDYVSRVGGQIPIGGSLIVEANALSDDALIGNRTNFMNIDASSTALFSVQLLTAGASYSSQSGATYLTSLPAVPIPAALPLMASALAALLLWHRKRAS